MFVRLKELYISDVAEFYVVICLVIKKIFINFIWSCSAPTCMNTLQRNISFPKNYISIVREVLRFNGT